MSKLNQEWLNIQMKIETPSGTVDGVNKNFTLSDSVYNNFVWVFVNGIHKRPVLDYTIVGSTLMLVDAPALAQSVYVQFIGAN